MHDAIIGMLRNPPESNGVTTGKILTMDSDLTMDGDGSHLVRAG
jgi:hypothetical protein